MANLNTVIAGEYEGRTVLRVRQELQLSTSLTEYIPLDRTTIESYRKVENAQGLGPAIFGGIYVEVTFKGGKQSIILLNKKYYDILIRNCHPHAPKKRKLTISQIFWRAFLALLILGILISIFQPGA